jgi:ER membrane protein SH3
VTPFITAGAGFLLAVLWFDLMHDVQLLDRRVPLAEAVDSIAAYYRRVTTSARPMNRLIALVMVATLVASVVQLLRDEVSNAAAFSTLLLLAVAIGIAGARTVANAVRLGTHDEPARARTARARSILSDHALCFGLVLTAVVIQFAFAR